LGGTLLNSIYEFTATLNLFFMKKIIAVTTLFIICANTLFAQPQKRKVAPKKPNNFSWGASNPTGTNASKSEVAVEALEVKEGGANDATFKRNKKPNQPNNATRGKRQHKPIN
jgi:hypothetical protein